MRRKTVIKICAALMAAILFILPMNVFAEINTNEILKPTEADAVQITDEDISKRGEFEKHFLQSDGTYLAVSYAEPVHKKMVDGSFEEIDNTLSLKNGRLENADDDFKVSFAEKSNNELVKISNDIYNLSWGLSSFTDETVLTVEDTDSLTDSAIQNNKQSGKLDNAGIAKERIFAEAKASKRAIVDEKEDLELLSAKERKMVAEKVSSALVYNDILGDKIDARYTVTPGTVKEDIILNSPTDFTGYAMNITAEGLTPIKQDDNSVVFLNDEDEAIFILQTPYMYDAAGETSYDINIEVEEAENAYRVVFTPNADWLNDDERAYPIVIDPIVSSTSSVSNIVDLTMTDAGGKNTTSSILSIGIGGSLTYRSVWKLNSLPTNVTSSNIVNATFYIKCSSNPVSSRSITLYGINSSWTTSNISFNQSRSALVSNVVPSHLSSIAAFGGSNVTSRVKEWYANSSNNRGFMIGYTDESMANPKNTSFHSSESAASGEFYPKIAITYSESILSNGIFYLKNKGTSKYLDVFDGRSAPGSTVWQYTYNGSPAQQWTRTSVFFRPRNKLNSAA